MNARAGRGSAARRTRDVADAIEAAFGISADVQLCLGESVEQTTAAAVASGADLVLAAGGDGTLAGVVNGVAGSGAAIGLIPMGTGNDFARAVGLPLDPLTAIRCLAHGRVQRLDVGVREGRRFINVAGCGFDAVVARRVNAGYRLLRGSAAYLAAVMGTLATHRPARFKLEVDGEIFEADAMMCAIANGTSYGGGMKVAPRARADDGMLDVCLVLACSKLEFILAFPRVYRGEHLSHRRVRFFRGRKVTVSCDPAQPVLMDGELVEPTPASFLAEPGAVPFLVPAGHMRR